MKGLGCQRYEILLVDMQGQAKQTREWTEAQLLGSVAWLKRMNARGHDVLIRPASRTGLVLLDRLTQFDVAKLVRSGVPFSAKIEVEEDRFQIWLHLGTAAASVKLRTGMARSLGLTPSDGGDFGALAGFINHQKGGQGDRRRFVLAHEPMKLGTETLAKWGCMLEDAEKIIRAQGKDTSPCHSKEFSR